MVLISVIVSLAASKTVQDCQKFKLFTQLPVLSLLPRYAPQARAFYSFQSFIENIHSGEMQRTTTCAD